MLITPNFVRILLSHPTKDVDELTLRHEVIEFFLKQENQIILKNLQECLRNVGNSSVSCVTEPIHGRYLGFHETTYEGTFRLL